MIRLDWAMSLPTWHADPDRLAVLRKNGHCMSVRGVGYLIMHKEPIIQVVGGTLDYSQEADEGDDGPIQSSKGIQVMAEETSMQALRELHDELVDLYGYEEETKMASMKLQSWLEEILANSSAGLDSVTTLGSGDPNNPDTKYQYKKTFRQLKEASAKDGSHAIIRRKSLVALVYALWEEKYRWRIAQECNLADRDKVESTVFQDLNKYRQAILHHNDKLGKKPQIIPLFKKGDVISPTEDHMHLLFSILIDELNQIGETYYNMNPQFSLDKPLH